MAGIFVDVCSRSLGRRAVVLLALAAWLALSAGAPLPAGAMALVAAEDLPFGPAAAGAFADLTGDGRLVLALVGEERAAVFDRPNPGGPWLPVTEIGPLPAPATAVGGGDINGDGVPELAVGTGNAGSVYVFRWAGSRWALLAQTPYVWSPVVSVQAGSLDGDDRAELVVLSASGDLAVFGWTGTDVALVWRWSGENGPVLQAQVADVTGDGVSELVAVDGAGRVTVWGWPFGDPVGQGFVWGTPVSMTVADIEGAGRQEVLVTTAERLLYRFGWQNSQLALLGAPVDDRTLPLEQMTPVPHPESGAVLLAGRSASGMGLFRIGGQGIEQVALGWAQAPQWMIPVPGGRGLVVAEEGRAPSIWTLEESDYFRLRADGQSVSVQDPPLLREDTVLLSMRDWASLFGWTLYWDPELRRLTAVGRNGFAILTVGQREVWVPGGVRLLPEPPVISGGRTYAAVELAEWFGMEAIWDPRRRQLDLRSRD